MMSRRFMALSAIALTFLTLSCGGPEEKKMKFFNKGKVLFENGDYVNARLEFRNALQIDRNFAQGYYMLGLVERRDDNFRKAYSLFSKAVELDPDLLDAQAALGRLLLIGKQEEKAREKVELVLAKNPNHEEALLVKAAILMRAGQEAEAETVLESVIERNQERTDAYLLLSDIKLNQRDIAGAKKTLGALLGHDERNRAARLKLIEILEKENDTSGAENEYKTLMLQYPDDDWADLMLARLYLRTNRSQEAEKLLLDLIAKRPPDVEPRLYLAQFYKHRGQNEAMLAVLKKAVEEIPDRFETYEILGNYYVHEKQEAKAVELMKQFMTRVATGPDFLKAQLFLAHVYYREKNPDKALELAEDVLKNNPADMNAHDLKGRIRAELGDFPGAIAEYRAILQQEPQNVPASLNLARAHLLNHETGLAEDIFKSVLQIDPQERQARLGLVDLYRRKGDLVSAQKQLEKLLELNPDDTQALMVSGDLALLKQDAEAAERYFNRLAALEPDAVHYSDYKQGLTKLLEKKPEEAASLFEKTLQADPDFVPALNQLIDMFVKEKALDKAFDRCRKQIAISPDNPHYHVLLGRLHIFNGDSESARNSFEQALKMDPNSADALFSLAQLEQMSGSIDGALARYQALRERYPNNPAIGLVMATLMEKKGDFAKAKVLYEEILRKNPDVYAAVNNLAFYYAEYEPTTENLAEGERLMQPVMDKFRDDPDLMDTTAWLYYRQGRLAKARDLLLSIEDKIGNRPVIQYHLGMIYLGLEQRAAAKEHLELAIRSKQDFPGRTEAERVLNDLS